MREKRALVKIEVVGGQLTGVLRVRSSVRARLVLKNVRLLRGPRGVEVLKLNTSMTLDPVEPSTVAKKGKAK